MSLNKINRFDINTEIYLLNKEKDIYSYLYRLQKVSSYFYVKKVEIKKLYGYKDKHKSQNFNFLKNTFSKIDHSYAERVIKRLECEQIKSPKKFLNIEGRDILQKTLAMYKICKRFFK
ncbi:hypothetical protein [Caminibacter pacificus]|uniref:Uncharacterized protein n=1 Tax=Caminibacter pacificus TaxID=1424653 RepID=A0AAJ4RB07_9BACT|nr:hypothetical protein [Caminibacter pacificus]QDD68203.1 hypothetical protein C6V80_10130 [Caminibacter pacificus]ROR38716.1 hypothetical protein EDC58_1931 [Caminibacter pacificus]